MDIIFLGMACFLFFIGSSIFTGRFLLILKSSNFTNIQIFIAVILSHLGNLFGVMMYDIAKKSNIIKFFIGGGLIFGSFQIMLHNSHYNFIETSMLSIVLYTTYNLVDLCCGILSRYIPFMFTVLLRNFGNLIGAIILNNIDYIYNIQGKFTVLYLIVASLLCILYTNINIKLKASNNSISLFDLRILMNEYTGLLLSFVFVNIIDMLLLRYLLIFLRNIMSSFIIISRLEIIFYLGKIILHYPMMLIFSYTDSKLKLIFLLFLNLLCILIIPIINKYSLFILLALILFLIGGFSLLRHGITTYFNQQQKEEHKSIPLDTALNKLRSISLILSLIIESIIILFINNKTLFDIIIYSIFVCLHICGLFCLITYKQKE